MSNTASMDVGAARSVHLDEATASARARCRAVGGHHRQSREARCDASSGAVQSVARPVATASPTTVGGGAPNVWPR